MFRGVRAPFLSLSLKCQYRFFMPFQNLLEPDSDDRKCDDYEGGDYGECPPRHQLSNGVNVSKDIRKTVVNLKPELEIRFHRGLNDEGKSHWERRIDFKRASKRALRCRKASLEDNSFNIFAFLHLSHWDKPTH